MILAIDIGTVSYTHLIRHTTLKWMVPESANAKKSEKE